jgi:hypothetical protein
MITKHKISVLNHLNVIHTTVFFEEYRDCRKKSHENRFKKKREPKPKVEGAVVAN